MIRYLTSSRLRQAVIFGVGLLWLSATVSAQEIRQESRIDDGNGIEVLASGPVHEAFAEPIVFDPKPGVIVPKAPPELVEELPPDQKPAGAHVVWIPGYWSWDEDRENFLWVSGFWRALPPGREWVPGYWTEVTGGSQWVSGFWANAADDGTEYLPGPPQTLETGPSTPQPSPDYFWVPGCWYWRNASYVWRPGYWNAGQSNWIWSPAHYVWTPRGHVFVGGYWDYALARRGMLFAPVYFNSPFYTRPGYLFSPTMAVNLGILTNHFFVGIAQRHYYFGDYYASSYGNRGYYPWFSFASSRYGYDPIYAHYHNQFTRTDRNWANRMRSDYEFRRDHEEARPERVASLNPRIQREDGQRADGNAPLVQPLTQLATASDSKGMLEALPSSQRTEAGKIGQQMREFTKQRMKTETDPNAKSGLVPQLDGQSKKSDVQPGQDAKSKVEGTNKGLRSAIVKRSKSPIVDTSKQEIPKPDSKAQPVVPGKEQPAVPKVAPKVEPKLPVEPKVPAQEKPIIPKAEPKPPTKEPVPKVEPKPPVKTPAVPKVVPPKVAPAIPKTEPPPKVRPEVPKVEPPPKVRPEVPRVEPPKVRPEVPKVEPKPKPSKPEKEPKK